jgi:hypothetical protein
MPKLSCNLRLTYHDGLPISTLQFLSAGRGCVTTVPIKYCEKVPLERKAVIEAIRKIQREGLNLKGSKYVRKNFTVKKFKKAI